MNKKKGDINMSQSEYECRRQSLTDDIENPDTSESSRQWLMGLRDELDAEYQRSKN